MSFLLRWAPRSQSEKDGRPLFHVFDLFAQPLQLFLDGDHAMIDVRVIGFGSDRIGFPVHLLRQEAEPLADWFLQCARQRLLEEVECGTSA